MAPHRLITTAAFITCLLAAAAKAQVPDAQRLSQLTAMDVGERQVLFAFDTADRAVVLADDPQATTPVTAFRRLPISIPLLSPLFSSDGEHLIIVDPPLGRFVEIDPVREEVVNSFSTSRFDAVTAFAVTKRVIALATRNHPYVTLLERETGRIIGEVEIREASVREILALGMEHFAVTYAGTAQIDEVVRRGESGWRVTPIMGIAAAEDVAQFEGIYYVLRRGAISVASPSRNARSPRAFPAPVASHIVATRDSLYLSGVEAVQRLPRIEPVTISAEDEDGRNGPALLIIYEYLANAALVVRQPMKEGPYESLEDVLQAVTNGSPWWESTLLSGSEWDGFAAILCRLNDAECATADALVAWVNAAKPSEMTVPDLAVTIQTLTRKRILGQSNTDAYLRNLPDEARARVTTEDILRVNADVIGSFDYEVARQGFSLLPTATIAFSAGTAIDLEKERVVPRPACIAKGPSATLERLTLPGSLETHRAKAVLPPIKGQLSALKLRQFGVHSVRIDFDAAGIEAIDDIASAGWASDPQCREFFDRGVAVVSRAMRLDGPRFQLLGENQRVLTPSPADLRNLNLALRSVDSWLVPVKPATLYIGYKAVRVAADGTVIEVTPRFDETRLFTENAELRLPVAAWSVATFALSRDIDSESSPLQVLVGKSAYVLAERQLTSAAEAEEQPADFSGEIQKNRRDLMEAIHFPAEEGANYSAAVGVAEACTSVDFQHPDFGTGSTYAWEGTQTCLPSVTDRDRRFRDFDCDRDHGSHVAGLLAARPGSPGVGLLPAAHLAFIERKDRQPLAFNDGVEEALKAATSVISCSFSWENSTQLKNAVMSKMQRGWADQLLFVVAAGSRGVAVRTEDKAPVIWVNDVPNILTVGASDFDHQRLTRTGRDGQEEGTNYGKDYVEIFAPAVDVISLASGSAYARTSGSSQAVPLVAATAALLSQQIQAPEKIKARLLYTTDWWSSLGDDVWAGELNAQRALREPTRSVCAVQSDPTTYMLARFDPKSNIEIGPDVVTRERRKPDQPNVQEPPPTLRMESVLRIQLLRDATFRIFFRHSSGQLRILENATIRGLLKCITGSADPLCDASGEFDASEIADYVAATPTGKIIFN